MSFEDVVSGRRHGDAQPTEDTSNSSMEGLDTLESLNERFDALGLALTVHMRKVESSCSRLLKLGEHVGSMRREDVSEITRALAAEKGRASASSGEMHRILAELSGIVALMAEWGDFEAVHNKMRELYLQYGRVAEMFSRASKMVNTIRLECQGSPAFMGRSIQTSSSVDGNMPSSTSNGGLHADAYGSMRQRTASSSQGSQGRATGGQAQTQVHVPIVVVDGRREQEFDSLVHELKELHGLFAELAGHVQREAVQVNTIEQHIVEAKAHMQQGNSDLKAASRYQVAAYPLLGAVVGGLVAGPVGVLAGLKGVAAIGACLAGLGIGAGAGQGIKKIAMKNVDAVDGGDIRSAADAIAHQHAVDDMAKVLGD